MAGLKSLLIVLVLLLLSPVAQSISWGIDDSDGPSPHSNQHTANGGWRMLANPVHSTYQISEATGFIHSPYGTFDPTIHPIPIGPWAEVGLGSPTREGIYIVQSSSSDLVSLAEHLIFLGISIIDHIPDEALIAVSYTHLTLPTNREV